MTGSLGCLRYQLTSLEAVECPRRQVPRQETWERNEERLMRCAAAHKANWAKPRGSAGGPWGLNGPGGGEGRRQPATTGSCPGRGAVIGPSRRVPGDPPTAWRPRSRGFPEAEGE